MDADAETVLDFTTDDIVTEQGEMAGLMVPEKSILARHRRMVQKFARKRNSTQWKEKGKPTERNFMQREYFRDSGSKESTLICTEITTDLPLEEVDDMLKN